MSENISKKDLAEIADENLLPSGSRVMQKKGKKIEQVYPAPPKLIKGNIAAELGYDDYDDPLEEYQDEDPPIDDESVEGEDE